jgi:hypothetical protein
LGSGAQSGVPWVLAGAQVSVPRLGGAQAHVLQARARMHAHHAHATRAMP